MALLHFHPSLPPSLTTLKKRKLLVKCSMRQMLWKGGLPPGQLIGLVRETWRLLWHVMMEQLAPTSKQGVYQRPISEFRSRPIPLAPPGRYHIYVSLTCPWAHRALILHALKGLAEAVPLWVATPGMSGYWELKNNPHGPLLLDVYSRDRKFQGRATVPMLWDSLEMKVVNNESADIIQILNSDFNHIAQDPQLNLARPHLIQDIDTWNKFTYTNINNGVYRCGFAQSQEAYDMAVRDLFDAIQGIEEHLATSRYLCGHTLTLADVRLFTTLFRFDAVYHILFKCSKQKLSELPNLYSYVRDIYQIPGVADTCDAEAIQDGYYKILFPLNPGGIRPSVPRSVSPDALSKPHLRHLLSSTSSDYIMEN